MPFLSSPFIQHFVYAGWMVKESVFSFWTGLVEFGAPWLYSKVGLPTFTQKYASWMHISQKYVVRCICIRCSLDGNLAKACEISITPQSFPANGCRSWYCDTAIGPSSNQNRLCPNKTTVNPYQLAREKTVIPITRTLIVTVVEPFDSLTNKIICHIIIIIDCMKWVAPVIATLFLAKVTDPYIDLIIILNCDFH